MTRGAAWVAYLAGILGGVCTAFGVPVGALAALAVGAAAVFDLAGWVARRWPR